MLPQSSKHFLKSKTIWASIVSLVSFIILFFMSKTMEDKYFALTGAIGAVGSIYGRFVAKEKLHVRRKHGKTH